VVDAAELLQPAAHQWGAIFAAVVEHPDHVNVGILLGVERLDQRFTGLPAADHDGAAREPAFDGPVAHEPRQRDPERHQHEQTGAEIAGEPDAREHALELGEERNRRDDGEHHGPGRHQPGALADRATERGHVVDVGGLKDEERDGRDAADGGEVIPVETVGRDDVPAVDRKADRGDQRELEHAHDPGKHDRRIGGGDRLGGDLKGGGRQLGLAAGKRRNRPGNRQRGRGSRGMHHVMVAELGHGNANPARPIWVRKRPGRSCSWRRLTGKVSRKA
jgi:hypothetical protein